MKKKLIPAFLLAATGLLASCGGEGKVADLFIYQVSDTYISSVKDAIVEKLEKEQIKVNVKDGQGKGETQMQQIDTALTSGAEILLANLVEQKANGDQVAKKAKDAGVPTIFFNREVPDSAVTAANYPDHCFVGTDPDQAGYMQGDIIAEGLIKDGKLSTEWDKNGDGKINYVMLRADVGNPEADGRTKYSVQQANKHLTEAGLAKLNQLGSDTDAKWSKDEAKRAMDTLIGTHGVATADKDGIELVIANNDDMALGAIEALKVVDHNKGGDGNKIMVVGVDATVAGVEAINAGQMFGTVKQDAEAMATCIAKLTVNKLNGKDYLDGTDYQWDTPEVHKIRIPYGKYTKA